MNYYIKTDADGFVSEAPVTEAKDGYTAVEIPVTSKEYFLRYFNKYRVVDGNVQAPANLPSLDIDSLQNIINQQATQIEAQTKTVAGLQQALGEATKAQVQAQQQFTETNQQFQTQFGALTKQLVELQQTVSKLQPTE